jgi:hypothetical protein
MMANFLVHFPSFAFLSPLGCNMTNGITVKVLPFPAIPPPVSIKVFIWVEGFSALAYPITFQFFKWKFLTHHFPSLLFSLKESDAITSQVKLTIVPDIRPTKIASDGLGQNARVKDSTMY